jgi:hypothetical protein
MKKTKIKKLRNNKKRLRNKLNLKNQRKLSHLPKRDLKMKEEIMLFLLLIFQT